MPQFDISTFSSQIFWLTIAFGIMLAFNHYIIMPKFANIFKGRQDKITGDIAAAEIATSEAEKIQSKVEEVRAELVVESDKLYNDYKAHISELEAEFSKKLNDKLHNINKQSEEKVNKQISAIHDQADLLAIDLSSDVLNELFNDPVDRQRIKKYLDI